MLSLESSDMHRTVDPADDGSGEVETIMVAHDVIPGRDLTTTTTTEAPKPTKVVPMSGTSQSQQGEVLNILFCFVIFSL